jgi:hypothetical protein
MCYTAESRIRFAGRCMVGFVPHFATGFLHRTIACVPTNCVQDWLGQFYSAFALCHLNLLAGRLRDVLERD